MSGRLVLHSSLLRDVATRLQPFQVVRIFSHTHMCPVLHIYTLPLPLSLSLSQRNASHYGDYVPDDTGLEAAEGMEEMEGLFVTVSVILLGVL